ncbi:sulfurtransferase TusA family protein [Photobacterium ganghwense]|uniref:SirA-like family protein n=3 Tax=Photobacterium TaxID=657 RepID=A0A0J1H4R5_9GAMM|nr:MULTISPECIES: sulfurtransferase TusA family protein [Photobacterium]KLV06730.1 sirA-like family protein [Photobacterium ganghwense]MBV1840153.1 sulfurtransferase TusA family protein [Photobacterium ganghwense]PSU05656.1 sulfurtransferase TusA family protein [Photobacterium ganghwense]QSV14701.1 sulfurtransferase TusA family protein [Photobacterium ganghwense]
MERALLNLTAERCPMALLLAKRAVQNLHSGESMEIHVTDTGARQDIPRYLSNHGFTIEVRVDNHQVLEIIVTKGL